MSKTQTPPSINDYFDDNGQLRVNGFKHELKTLAYKDEKSIPWKVASTYNGKSIIYEISDKRVMFEPNIFGDKKANPKLTLQIEPDSREYLLHQYLDEVVAAIIKDPANAHITKYKAGYMKKQDDFVPPNFNISNSILDAKEVTLKDGKNIITKPCLKGIKIPVLSSQDSQNQSNQPNQDDPSNFQINTKSTDFRSVKLIDFDMKKEFFQMLNNLKSKLSEDDRKKLLDIATKSEIKLEILNKIPDLPDPVRDEYKGILNNYTEMMAIQYTVGNFDKYIRRGTVLKHLVVIYNGAYIASMIWKKNTISMQFYAKHVEYSNLGLEPSQQDFIFYDNLDLLDME